MTNEQLPKSVWPCVNYADAPAAITFLADAFGFVSTATYTDEDDDRGRPPCRAALARGRRRDARLGGPRGERVLARCRPARRSVYVVTDEPDAVHDRAVKAGAEIVRGLVDEDYGSRGFTARDPEGNLWSFGTYRGHAG